MQVSRETWVVFTIRTLNSLGWAATMPFLAVYLEVERGVPLVVIGITYLIAGLLTFVSQIVGGRLTDAAGPKRVMLTAYGLSLVASIGLGVLLQLRAPISDILVMYPLFSLVRGLSQPATSSIIANQSKTQYRKGFSLLVIGGNLGFAIGPAFGGILADIYSYAVVFELSGITSIIATLLTKFVIQGGTRQTERENRDAMISKKWLRWNEEKNFILFLFLTMSAFVALGFEITPLSLYAAGFLGFSNSEIGYLFATNGALIVLFQLPLTRITERMRNLLSPLVLSCFLIFCSYLIVSVANDFAEMEIAMLVVSIAEIFLTVPAQTIATLFSARGNRGTYQGYYAGFSGIGRSLATFIGPLSLQVLAFVPEMSWVLIAVFSLFVGVCFFLLSSKLQHDYQKIYLRESSTIS